MIVFTQGVIMTLIESLCCRIFFDSFLVLKFQNKVMWNRMLLIMLMCGFFFVSFFPAGSYLVKASMAILLISIIMKIHYCGKYLQILFFSMVYYGIVISIDRIMLIVVKLAVPPKFYFILQDGVKVIVLGLLCKTVLFMCMVFINKKFKKTNSFFVLSDSEWVRFLYFPIMTLISMTVIAITGSKNDYAILIIAFGLILSNFMVFYMIQDIVERDRQIQFMRISDERAKNQITMYHYMKELYNVQRTKVHEFKNHITCIQGLMQQEKYREVSDYTNRLNDLYIDTVDYVNTNNPVVNAVINQKFKLAKSKGIPMIMSVNDLRDILFSEEDIVILLGNLLDNAIEACDKLENDRGIIKLKFINEGGKITISIRNPVQKEVKIVEDRVVTTKKDKINHGIGLENIETIVKKYNGENVISCRKGFFTHTIII